MNRPRLTGHNWDESTSASTGVVGQSGRVFESFFTRSVDAALLLDPQAGVFVDGNQAALELLGATDKTQLLQARPQDLAPPVQPDGSPTAEKLARLVALVEKHNGYRFDWLARRLDGREVPLEVSATPIQMGGRKLHVLVSRDNSERKQAERELVELNQSLERRALERTEALTTSEARFRVLVEHAPEAIVVFDAKTGRFLFGNQHACRLYGVPMEKLATLTPADVSPEFQPGGRRSSELAREKMEQALAGENPVFEWTHQRPDGCLIPTEVRLLRLPAEGQNLIRASIIDNTERQNAQRALRESEEKFRALFEGSSQGVVLHDENQILEVNPAAVRILGRQSPQELLGRHPSETSPPLQPNGESSASLARQHIQQCLTHGSARFDWLSSTPEGCHVPLEVALTRIQWSGRRVIQAFITDITERKQAEYALREANRKLRHEIEQHKRSQTALAESEARFSVAFQASPVFIGIARMSDGRFVLANDAFVNWTGYTRDEIMGRNTTELIVWERQEDREAYWAELRRTGSIRARECRFRNRSGRLSTMLLSSEVIQLNGVPHMLTLGLDITERKQAEAELHRALAREMELSQLKSNFVSMVSHEFRTPLGIIQSSAELLRDFHEKMPPTEREAQLESVIRNARRMAAMMEEMLVLSRLEAGKLEFQPAALDLSGCCRRIVDEVLSATNRRCPIELSLDSVPPEAKADERLLGHIFTNLLSNAVKYSEPGKPVHFSVERDEADAVCMVRDRGIGIAGADQEHMFKAFHRGVNVGTRPGTGLGLFMVKRCVELHRGTVQLVSSLGEGTTVIVRLPIFGSDL